MMMIPIQVLLTIEKFLVKGKRKKSTSEIYAFVQNGFAITCKQLKVFNSKEVGEVQEGADCYSARKLSKHCKG